MKACVRTASFIDDEMDDFDHTPLGRDVFAPLSRQKCSKLLAVPCAFFLTAMQNRLRPDNFTSEV